MKMHQLHYGRPCDNDGLRRTVPPVTWHVVATAERKKSNRAPRVRPGDGYCVFDRIDSLSCAKTPLTALRILTTTVSRMAARMTPAAGKV